VDDRPRVEQLDGHRELIVHGGAEFEGLAWSVVEQGDVVLRYSFWPDDDPHEYGYTYFDVVFAAREPPHEPFWPIRFTVGFH
jgi:hypothetical protein